MSEFLQFAGCLAAVALYAALLYRCGSGLLGLASLNLFMVSSAMLSGFFISIVFGRPLAWFDEEHSRVVTYGVCGVMAMIGGMFLGWRPVRDRLAHETPALHLNQRLGWITFWVGTAFELVYPVVATIPTVSTA